MAINISKTESNKLKCGYRGENVKSSHAQPSFGWEIHSPGKINVIKGFSDRFTSADQRLLMGVTAILTQPFFDLYNKRVDEQTRTVSCARTIGKILAGTLTGVSIRWMCIKGLNAVCKNEATEIAKAEKAAKKAAKKGVQYVRKELELKPWQKSFLPKNGSEMSLKEVNKYKNAFGTLAATFIMIFTNFLIDAPLTTFFTNILTKKIQNTKPKDASKEQAKTNVQKGDS